MHMVTEAYRPPMRCSSDSALMASTAPEAPIGWPSAVHVDPSRIEVEAARHRNRLRNFHDVKMAQILVRQVAVLVIRGVVLSLLQRNIKHLQSVPAPLHLVHVALQHKARKTSPPYTVKETLNDHR
jgi:hypothetical protein